MMTEREWGKWANYSPAQVAGQQALYFGLIMWNTLYPSPNSAYFYPVTGTGSGMTLKDIADNESFTYYLTWPTFQDGYTYKLIPVFTTYDAGNSTGTWIYFDANVTLGGYFFDINTPEILITPTDGVHPSNDVDVEIVDFTWSVSNVYITVSNIQFTIENDNLQNITSTKARAYVKDVHNQKQYIGSEVNVGTVAPGSANKYSGTITSSLTYETGAEEQCTVFLEYWFTYDGQVQPVGTTHKTKKLIE